jgi:hypothetical protein
MQCTNDCYTIDAAGVQAVITHLDTAGYHLTPHWYLTHYAKAVTISDTRRGLSIDADQWTWGRYAGLFYTEANPRAIVQQLLLDGWQKRRSYIFAKRRATVTLVETVVEGHIAYVVGITGKHQQLVHDLVRQFCISSM